MSIMLLSAAFAVSIVLVIIGIAAMVFNGTQGKGVFNFDIEFTGGTAMTVDMGGEFDWFSPVSGHDYAGLTDTQKANRLLLKNGMMDAGFSPYSEEWWHYRLKDEPYPDTYFDFVIE